MGELIGSVTSEKNGLYPKDKVYLIDKLNQKSMGFYDQYGNYVEIITIKKVNNPSVLNIAVFQIQNIFYGSGHSAIINVYFSISDAVKAQIISKAVQGGIFDLYSYDDGTLLHIYAHITGGNTPGRITIYKKLSDINTNEVSINITLTQSTTIPEGAKLIE